jgi:Phospholipase_D-nuclease N-terminal
VQGVIVLLRVGGIGFVVLLAVWLYCLLDVITSDESRVRHLPKVAWVLIVLLLFEVGAALWLIAGRPRGDGGPVRSRQRPAELPPDDDPEFLADLRRRQEERRRREQDGRGDGQDQP